MKTFQDYSIPVHVNLSTWRDHNHPILIDISDCRLVSCCFDVTTFFSWMKTNETIFNESPTRATWKFDTFIASTLVESNISVEDKWVRRENAKFGLLAFSEFVNFGVSNSALVNWNASSWHQSRVNFDFGKSHCTIGPALDHAIIGHYLF